MGNLKKTINSGSNRVVRMTISKMHGTAVYLNVSVDQDQDYPKGEGVEECDIITERLPFWKGSTIRIFCTAIP